MAPHRAANQGLELLSWDGCQPDPLQLEAPQQTYKALFIPTLVSPPEWVGQLLKLAQDRHKGVVIR
jgi:hypothetical protein